MFDQFVSLHLRQDKKSVNMNLPDFLKKGDKEDLSVFDRNGYTAVEEIFRDSDMDTRWLKIVLSNDCSICVDEDQQFVLMDGEEELLIRAGEISVGMKLPFCQEKFPNPKAVIDTLSVMVVLDIPPKEGVELMTESQSYVAGGFLLASI